MKVLALDVSTTTTGYAILDSNLALLKKGQFTLTDRKLSDTLYALAIEQKIMKLVKNNKIDDMIIEDVFYGKNIKFLKTWCRVHGAIATSWYKKFKKEPVFMMASTARNRADINGKSKKIEVQLEIGKRFQLIDSNCYSKYSNKFKEAVQIKTEEYARIEREIKKKSEQKTEKKKVNGKFNYRVQKLSVQFEKETGLSEHVADSIVLATAFFK